MKKVPVCSGVPESTPLAARLSPAGNEPAASENVAVPIAPLCVKVWLNGEPATPLFAPGGVTVMVWQVIVRLYVVPVPVQPFASVTVTVIGKLPTTAGMPES